MPLPPGSLRLEGAGKEGVFWEQQSSCNRTAEQHLAEVKRQPARALEGEGPGPLLPGAL